MHLCYREERIFGWPIRSWHVYLPVYRQSVTVEFRSFPKSTFQHQLLCVRLTSEDVRISRYFLSKQMTRTATGVTGMPIFCQVCECRMLAVSRMGGNLGARDFVLVIFVLAANFSPGIEKKFGLGTLCLCTLPTPSRRVVQ